VELDSTENELLSATHIAIQPIKLDEAVLLTYIQEVMHSNFGQTTNYPEVIDGFSWSRETDTGIVP
jgi:hypothetical protein